MLKQRIITALVIAPVSIACVFFLPYFGFAVFVAAVLTVSAWEWANLAGYDGAMRYVYATLIAALMAIAVFLPPMPVLAVALAWWILAVLLVVRYPGLEDRWASRPMRSLIGIIALVPGFVSLLELKQMPDANFLILLLFFLIWGADIGAYFSGKAFGKAKLMPRVSPGKSWAGFWGGMATSVVIAVGMSLWLGKPALTSTAGLVFVAICLTVAVISVFGDLTLSMFKRHRGIKDSSSLLPGHGGFLDRLDSLMAAGPTFALLMLIYGWR